MSVQTRILGIDFGEKRLGIAVSDPMRIIAQSLPTLTCRSPSDAIEQVAEVVEVYEVGEIVIGLPVTLSGSSGVAADKVTRFADRLQQQFDLPVTFVDERFTSVIAEKALRSAGKEPSRNKSKIDRISASLILQSYLDARSTIQNSS